MGLVLPKSGTFFFVFHPFFLVCTCVWPKSWFHWAFQEANLHAHQAIHSALCRLPLRVPKKMQDRLGKKKFQASCHWLLALPRPPPAKACLLASGDLFFGGKYMCKQISQKKLVKTLCMQTIFIYIYNISIHI